MGHQRLIGESSESHQRVIGESSENHWIGVYNIYDPFYLENMFIRHVSFNCQINASIENSLAVAVFNSMAAPKVFSLFFSFIPFSISQGSRAYTIRAVGGSETRRGGENYNFS